jgi:GT2 family glycosyltransferase
VTAISVLTLVRNREAHLRELVEGLRRSRRPPDELVVMDMSDEPITPLAADFPIAVERLEMTGLPLALARNRAAARARHDHLLFLDVDCIPMRDCVGRLGEVLDARDGLACADIRYLGPADARSGWTERTLVETGRPHPVRSFPAQGVRIETNPGLFWSLGFAVRRETFHAIGRFDETFCGYGAEDTDFGFRSATAGVPLLFVAGAVACHQYHETFEPPLQHLDDIVANARRFHAIWGRWPMEGWLDAFRSLGLIEWTETGLQILRRPTEDEREIARTSWVEAASKGRGMQLLPACTGG